MSGIPCVVLAGGKASPLVAAEINSSVRAAVVFQGRRLLDIVVEALAEADPTSPICVVANLPEMPTITHIADQGDFVANLVAGVAVHADAAWVLITSCDMPFLTGTVVEEFCRAALTLAATTGADIVYPIVPVSECYTRYPGIKRTAIKLREGEFTGGNMILARPSFLLQQRAVIGQTYASRKNPVHLAWILGPDIVMRLLVSQTVVQGSLELALLERRIGSLLGGTVAALICQHAEIATDLDRASDFASAAAYVNQHRPQEP